MVGPAEATAAKHRMSIRVMHKLTNDLFINVLLQSYCEMYKL
jgi:hypothetical protein